MPFLSLSEAKAALNITTSEFDEELGEYVDAAQDAVDFLCGPTTAVTVTETVYGFGAIALNTTPILSLTSVTGQSRGALTVSDLWVNAESGVVRAKSNVYPIREDYYEVVYQAGRSGIPAGIKRGAEIIVSHQWETQRGGSRRPGRPTDTTMIPGLGYAIPNRALQAMDRYLRGPGVG